MDILGLFEVDVVDGDSVLVVYWGKYGEVEGCWLLVNEDYCCLSSHIIWIQHQFSES